MQSENCSRFAVRSVALTVQHLAPPTERRLQLFAFEGQHLPPAVVTAWRAGDVRRDGTSALWTFVQLRRVPAVRRFACAQPHLRCFAFWNSHGRRLRKHPSSEKQVAQKWFVKKVTTL